MTTDTYNEIKTIEDVTKLIYSKLSSSPEEQVESIVYKTSSPNVNFFDEIKSTNSIEDNIKICKKVINSLLIKLDSNYLNIIYKGVLDTIKTKDNNYCNITVAPSDKSHAIYKTESSEILFERIFLLHEDKVISNMYATIHSIGNNEDYKVGDIVYLDSAVFGNMGGLIDRNKYCNFNSLFALRGIIETLNEDIKLGKIPYNAYLYVMYLLDPKFTFTSTLYYYGRTDFIIGKCYNK